METLSQKFKRKRSNELKASEPSKSVEVKYRDELLKLINTLKSSMQERIRAFMEQKPTSDELMLFVTSLIEEERKKEMMKYAFLLSSGVVFMANKINKERLSKIIGGDSDKNNVESLLPDVKEKLDEYISKNVSLITSVRSELLENIEKEVRKSYLETGRVENLATILQEKADISKNRARVIARDQTNKINSELDQERMQNLGIKLYTWQTSRDERVRSSHKIMQGLTCRFDDDSVYSKDGGKTWLKRTAQMPKVKPGIEIQCRCFANGVINEDKWKWLLGN